MHGNGKLCDRFFIFTFWFVPYSIVATLFAIYKRAFDKVRLVYWSQRLSIRIINTYNGCNCVTIHLCYYLKSWFYKASSNKIIAYDQEAIKAMCPLSELPLVSGKDNYSVFLQKFLWIASNIVKPSVGTMVVYSNQSSSYLASHSLMVAYNYNS